MIEDKKNILLLGGTGAMGLHLTNLLSNCLDYNVYVSSRYNRKDFKNVHYIQGNAHEERFIIDTINSHDWSCIVDFMDYDFHELHQKIDLLLKHTDQYVFISSCRIYAKSAIPIIESSDRLLDTVKEPDYLASNEYGLNKAKCEDILKNSSLKNWTIVRPYITYSEKRLKLGDLVDYSWLYRALHNRTIVFSQDIADHYTTLSYGLDVSYCISKLICNKDAIGEDFNITGTDHLKWMDVLSIYTKTIQNEFGIRPKVLLLDKSIYSKNDKLKYQLKYDRIYDRIFDNSKILSIVPDYSFTLMKEGLNKCLTAFIKDPSYSRINWIEEAIKDKLTHDTTPMYEIKGIKNKIRYFIYKYSKYNQK